MSQSTNESKPKEGTEKMDHGIHAIQSELTIITADEWLDDSDDAEVVALKEQLDAAIIAKSNEERRAIREQNNKERNNSYNTTNYRNDYRDRSNNYETRNRYNSSYNARDNSYNTRDNSYNNRDSASYRDNNRYRDGGRGRSRGRDRGRGRSGGRGQDARSHRYNNSNDYTTRSSTKDNYSNSSYSNQSYNSQNKYNQSYSTDNNAYSSTNDTWNNDYTASTKYNKSQTQTYDLGFSSQNKYDSKKQYSGNQYDQSSSYNRNQKNYTQHATYSYQPKQQNYNASNGNASYAANTNYTAAQSQQPTQNAAPRDPTPQAPADCTLSNMRHPAYFNSDVDLTSETLHALVTEALSETFFEPLIKHIQKISAIEVSDIAKSIGDILDSDYHAKTHELRQQIVDDEFGDTLYSVLDRYYRQHKGDGASKPIQNTEDNAQMRLNMASGFDFDAQMTAPPGSKGSAYVSYCLPRVDAFILCASVLSLALKRSGCMHKRVLLLPEDSWDASGNLKDYCRIFGELWDECIPFKHNDAIPYQYLKVHGFGLIEYAKIMFIEPYCITNDDNLDTYFDESQAPCAPDNSEYGQQYDVMIIEPNKEQYLELFKAIFHTKEVKDRKATSDEIEQSVSWTTIENESDKDEFLFNVLRSDVEHDSAEESFVLAYFQDASPWELYKDVSNATESCIALHVWMETARTLVKEYASLARGVDPKVLRVIDPEFGAHEVAEEDGNKGGSNAYEYESKDVGAQEEDESTSESESDDMPTPPPNYYVTRRDPEEEEKEANKAKEDDQKKRETESASDASASDAENDALKPRDVDQDDDDD